MVTNPQVLKFGTVGSVGFHPIIMTGILESIRGFHVSKAKAILLADDSKDDLEALQRALHNSGIANPIFITRNGNQVIDYLMGQGMYADRNSFPVPAILLLDLNMPGVDGFDVLEWCKTQPGLENLLIVVLSGHHGVREVNQAYALGADSFLFKPCKEADLHILIRGFPEYWIHQPPSGNTPSTLGLAWC
jgi:CheY-like chemotaxis protein